MIVDPSDSYLPLDKKTRPHHMSKNLIFCILLGLQISPASGDVFFQLRPASDGAVNLFIQGSGFVSGTTDNFLLVGTINDTFLPDRAPQRYSGLVPSAPTPELFLDGVAALNNFYRDDGGGFPNGISSLLGFYFGAGTLNGTLNLRDLNGTYYLPESRFSDFLPGTYTGLQSSMSPVALQGLGEVTLQVIPEPASFSLFLGMGAFGVVAMRRSGIYKRAQQARCSELGDGALVDNGGSVAPGH